MSKLDEKRIIKIAQEFLNEEDFLEFIYVILDKKSKNFSIKMNAEKKLEQFLNEMKNKIKESTKALDS